MTIHVDLDKALRLSGKGVPERLFPTGTSVYVDDAVVERNSGFEAVPDAVRHTAFTVEVPESLQRFTVEFTPEIVDPGYVRDADPSGGTEEVTHASAGAAAMPSCNWPLCPG